MDDSRNNDTPDETQGDANGTERGRDFTRRALLRAGWVTPLVTAVTIPALAQSPVPPHSDVLHSDVLHSDVVHGDVVHSDTPPPHTDLPHGDTFHVDVPHQDSPDHLDSHADTHAD